MKKLFFLKNVAKKYKTLKYYEVYIPDRVKKSFSLDKQDTGYAIIKAFMDLFCLCEKYLDFYESYFDEFFKKKCR